MLLDLQTIYDTMRKIFINKSTKKFDYLRLYNCVIGLSNAEWIDLYKPGTYSNFKDIISKKIFIHLKEFIESLMIIILDLDNTYKIGSVAEKLIDINSMQAFSDIIPELQKAIKELNYKFYKQIHLTSI